MKLASLTATFLLMIMGSGCTTQASYHELFPENDTPASGLPLLPDGNHLGMIVGFNASNPSATEENVDEAFVDYYGEVLNTIGLIRWEDGSRKPAWNTFEEWLVNLN